MVPDAASTDCTIAGGIMDVTRTPFAMTRGGPDGRLLAFGAVQHPVSHCAVSTIRRLKTARFKKWPTGVYDRRPVRLSVNMGG
jgi:hypothetical protein